MFAKAISFSLKRLLARAKRMLARLLTISAEAVLARYCAVKLRSVGLCAFAIAANVLYGAFSAFCVMLLINTPI